MPFSLSGKDFDIVRFTTRCKTVCLPWRVFYRLARHSREIYALYSPRQCSELHNDDVCILKKVRKVFNSSGTSYYVLRQFIGSLGNPVFLSSVLILSFYLKGLDAYFQFQFLN